MTQVACTAHLDVCLDDVQRQRIRLRVHDHRLQAQRLDGARHAARNLAAIGDQHPRRACVVMHRLSLGLGWFCVPHGEAAQGSCGSQCCEQGWSHVLAVQGRAQAGTQALAGYLSWLDTHAAARRVLLLRGRCGMQAGADCDRGWRSGSRCGIAPAITACAADQVDGAPPRRDRDVPAPTSGKRFSKLAGPC